MFGHRFFGSSYYGPSYFGQGSDTPAPVVTPRSGGAGERTGRRRGKNYMEFVDLQNEAIIAMIARAAAEGAFECH